MAKTRRPRNYSMTPRPYQSQIIMIKQPRALLDLTDQTFGRLTVIYEAFTAVGEGRYWVCKCICGNECQKTTSQLRDKARNNISCGCALKDSIAKASRAAWSVTTKFSHPHKKKLKWVLGNMISRCHKPGTRRYERYGGRGIKVCDEWKNNHTAFFEWAVKAGYAPGLSIERINRDGDYCPENCKFADIYEQANNTCRNRFITWSGKTLTIAQWSREIPGMTQQNLTHRFARGWSVEDCLTKPLRVK